MSLNRMQKIIIVVYLFVLAFLFLHPPLVKSFPCGCKFTTQAWLWGDKPLVFDFHPNPSMNSSITLGDWSIDWQRLAPRFLVASVIALFALVLVRKKYDVAR